MTHAQKAAELFCQGYNCAQAVFCAFCDEMNMDKNTALRLSSSFGGGMGRMREVCGAVSGMFMVAGMLFGEGTESDDAKKKAHYSLIQKMAARFREKNGTIICRDLLSGIAADSLPTPSARTEEYYKTRPCVRFVIDACDVMDEIISSKKDGE